MNTKHAKSPCCRGEIIKYGRRRRQCVVCQTTWRIRKQKQGRKKKRYSCRLLEKYLDHKIPVISKLAELRSTSRRILDKRLIQELSVFVRKTPWPKVPQDRDLVAIADAMIKKIDGKTHSIYFILLRPVDSNKAIITRPLIAEGKESSPLWKKAFGRLPRKALSSIKAIVCDGHLGLRRAARSNGWIIQRCHFHLLASLQGRRSRSKYSLHQKMGKFIYQTALAVLNTKDEKIIVKRLDRFKKIIPTVSSPRFKWMLAGFIRDHRDYRSYLKYPELNLPKTSNVAEAVISMVRDLCYKARGFRTKKSLRIRISALVKYKKTVVCNGHLPTK